MTRADRPDALGPDERQLARELARAAPLAGPSAALDDAVLGAARAEADARAGARPTAGRQRPRRRAAWLRGGALAASLVVAIGVAWQLKPRLDAPGPVAAPVAAPASAPVPAPVAAPPSRSRYAQDPDAAAAAHDDALHLDQPLDDTPPASLASPDVRDAWLARIRDLVAAGREDEARASFAEFRRRHPDATIPDDLQGLLQE